MGSKKGDILYCSECGLEVTVSKSCDCDEECVILCCNKPMKKKEEEHKKHSCCCGG